MTASSERFAGRALRLRGRTGLTQRDVAAALNVHVRSVQLWEAAASHPSANRLQGLIRLFLEAGAFGEGTELEEAEALWLAATSESSRLLAEFDADWFTRLIDGSRTAHAEPVAPPGVSPVRTGTRQHWSGAPDVGGFLSRVDELATLRRWIVEDTCRVVVVLGMGGIGKTLLAARAAHDFEGYFENAYWRTLRNAPPFDELVSSIIGFLSPQDPSLLANERTRFERLFELLSESPTLLVLDNVETLLQPGERTGGYVAGYAAYGDLFRRMAESPHRSCLVLTSREEPPELGPLKGSTSPTRTLGLGGLAPADVQVLLADKQLQGDDADWSRLVTRYTGNGLALKLIGQSIHELFGGDIKAFVDDVDASQGGLFGGVRQLLESQVGRLSEAELRVVRRLGVEREAMSFAELANELRGEVSRAESREAVEALLRRSLLERHEPGPTFTLQSVILEFVTEQIVAQAAVDLDRGVIDGLRTQPLINAVAKDYVRRTQERLIGFPVLEQLVRLAGGRTEAERRLSEYLSKLRALPLEEQGYAPGNAINLLRLLRGDLRMADLSDLSIRRVYLADVDAQDTSLARSQLAESVITEAFHHASVALSPDGAHLMAGTTSGDVCLWRAADRTLLLSMAAHAGMVWRVALALEQDLAASASEDGTVKLWRASSGEVLATLAGHTDFVQGVAVGGGGLIASGSQDGTVRLWRAPTGEPLRTLRSPAGGVLSVALTHDAQRVIAGTQDGAVAFWDVTSGRLLESVPAHTGPVPGLAVSHSGRLLATGSLDGTVRLWDTGPVKLRHTLDGHTGGVWNVSLSADDRLVASASQDGTVRVWSTAKGEPLRTLTGHTGDVWDVSLSADGKLVASAGQDGSIRFSDCSTGQLLTSMHGYTTAVWDVSLSNDGARVASASQDGTVTVWNAASGEMQHRLFGHASGVVCVALSRDGTLLASASQDGTVKLWGALSGQLHRTLTGHAAGTVWAVALSSDGRIVASGSFDGTIKLWDTQNGELLSTLRGHARGVRSVAMTDQVLLSGSQDGSLKVWDLVDRQPVGTLSGHTSSVQSVALDAEGRLAASGSFDGAIRVWDLAGASCLHSMDAHRGGVLSVSLSARGDRLVSGGFDRNVKVWDVQTGQLLATLSGHTGAVWGLSLNPEGSLLASGSFDGTTRLWNLSSDLFLRSFQVDRPYERMDITGLTGITRANHASLTTLGAIDHSDSQASSQVSR
jgi:WD40 repeat protein/transcriptional regulator with XRE-family HTH domain